MFIIFGNKTYLVFSHLNCLAISCILIPEMILMSIQISIARDVCVYVCVCGGGGWGGMGGGGK